MVLFSKEENVLKGNLDLIPSLSPSVKIQIMGRKVGLRCKGKTLLGVVNKLLKTKRLLTSPSNFFVVMFWPNITGRCQQTFFTPQGNFPAHNLNFH